jgi:voltage-gated potassium channel
MSNSFLSRIFSANPRRGETTLKIFHYKRILIVIILILANFVLGISGFMLIEGYSFLDAFYMTTITITTTGFGEVSPLTAAGKIFTSILCLTSIGAALYGVTTLTSFLVDGEILNLVKNFSMNKQLNELKNHVIVCGFGRNGKQVCEELEKENRAFVIIESNEERLEYIKELKSYIYIDGDATNDEVLTKAKIKDAKALITTLPNDPDNVYVVLTAREMNPGITIISRASDESSEAKLKRAGANNVIMPERIGGTHMATLVTKPDIMEFIALMTGQAGVSISFEEFQHENIKPEFKNKTIKQLSVKRQTGATIIGLKSEDGMFHVNPGLEMKVEERMNIIALGTKAQLEKLKNILVA